jgi:glyoxylase-like metal-dependent hydrolase (beta-lactamase superfamily II)
MGNAERLRTQVGAAVLVHHDDRAAAMRKAGRSSLYPLWKPPVLHLVGHFLRNGVARTVPVAESSGFADEEVLDVPGRPRVIHTPGHTAGNAALNLADREVLIVGDTLATLSLLPGESGPQLLPRFLNEDHDRALASLERSSRSRLAGSCPVTVCPGRALLSRPSSWPGRSRPGQVEGPARAHWRKERDQPGHRVDRHALRAIVNGAVHGDSALVSADQLMAASRRDQVSGPGGRGDH